MMPHQHRAAGGLELCTFFSSWPKGMWYWVRSAQKKGIFQSSPGWPRERWFSSPQLGLRTLCLLGFSLGSGAQRKKVNHFLSSSYFFLVLPLTSGYFWSRFPNRNLPNLWRLHSCTWRGPAHQSVHRSVPPNLEDLWLWKWRFFCWAGPWPMGPLRT